MAQQTPWGWEDWGNGGYSMRESNSNGRWVLVEEPFSAILELGELFHTNSFRSP